MENYFDWFKSQKNILGILVIGSYARGEQKVDSDLDIMILCDEYVKYIEDRDWLTNFGAIKSSKLENWGATKSLRVFFENGDEVEFGFSTNSWANTNPIDNGTKEVMNGGYKVLYDPKRILKKLSEEL